MKSGAEMGRIWPQAKGRLEPPEAGRGKEGQRERDPADTLIWNFRPPET